MDLVKLNVKVATDNSGYPVELPALFTEQGMLEPLFRYCNLHRHARSRTWMNLQIQAVRLFLQYATINYGCYGTPKELFRGFVQHLYSGTLGLEGMDPSGLYWQARRRYNANRLISYLSEFTEWMADQYGTTALNPMRTASRHEEWLNWAAYHQRHSRAFLAHTWDKQTSADEAKRTRSIPMRRPMKVGVQGVKYFAEEHFEALLFQGFRWDRNPNGARGLPFNVRDMLITLLMHGGGLRMSEPFHLYIDDVRPDPIRKRETGKDIALVRIYHPSEGEAPSDWLDGNGKPHKTNRGAYLMGKYGMKPRNEYLKGSLHAGWKGLKLDDAKGKYINVHWFSPIYGELFYTLWRLYLQELRGVERHHPFAFVTLQGMHRGKPLSIDAFAANYERAIRRIGLEPAKLNGTTPHGHRHAYGQRMTNAGIDPVVRQKALHHASLESQTPYCEPNMERVSRELNEAVQRLERGEPAPALDFDFLQYGFDDVDPQGLLSGPNPLLRKRKHDEKEDKARRSQ